jgi:hypothetical protein
VVGPVRADKRHNRHQNNGGEGAPVEIETTLIVAKIVHVWGRLNKREAPVKQRIGEVVVVVEEMAPEAA